MIFLAVSLLFERSFIARLYDEYAEQMYYAAFKILNDKSEAEDALHNAFENIMKYPGKIKELNDHQLAKYLNVVVRNSANKIYNQRKQNKINLIDVEELEHIASSDLYEPETVFFHKYSFTEMAKKINQLDEIYQDVIFASVVHNFNNKRIEKILSLKEETVRKRLYRGKKQLEELIRKEQEINEK